MICNISHDLDVVLTTGFKASRLSLHDLINLAAEIEYKWSLTVNPVLQVSAGEEVLTGPRWTFISV